MKIFLKRSLICLILLLLTLSQLNAQDRKVLNLNQAIEIALEKSFSRKSLGLRLESAGFGLNAAKGRFKTNADLSLQIPSFSENVQEIQNPEGLPVFNTTGTTRFQSNLNINQPLPTDGLITLSSTFYHNNQSVFLPEAEQETTQKQFLSSFRLQLLQPLFTLNTLKAGFEKANLEYERAQRQFNRTELDIIFNVTRSFFDLYRATRELEIAQGTASQQKASFELAKKKFEAGLIPEVEALQMEVDYAQSQNDVLSAEGSLKRQEDSFKQLIGLALSENVVVQTDFDYTGFDIDDNFAVEQALNHRTEIRELEIDRRLAEINVREVDSRVDFRVDLRAYIDITGIGRSTDLESDLNYLVESSFDDISRRPKNKGVIVNVTMPLWDWGVNSNEVAEANSDLEETVLSLQEQKKTVEREVRAVVSQVREAQGRLEVLRKSEEIAKKSYDISLARFENGDITSQELALDRDRLTAAKTAYLNAYVEYQLATADLQRKTLWDFKNNRSLIEN